MQAMTEADWSQCQDPDRMLAFLRGKLTARTIQLFVCCCCRRVWDHLRDACREAVEVTEGVADGALSQGELTRVEQLAWAESQEPRVQKIGRVRVSSLAVWCATRAHDRSVSTRSSADYASLAFGLEVEGGPKDVQAQAREKGVQCDLLREMICNPFRPVKLDHSWLTAMVRSLAQAAYDERILPSGELDPARLAILADALEDAGCHDEQVLEHCRGNGPHVRGCFVVDLLLGKS
jgi:hypothetical protein